MVLQWYNDPNYSHGFLVPIIAGYFLYQRIDTLKRVPVSPYSPGFLIFVAGLLILIIAYMGTEYFTMRSSLIIIIAGIVLYFFGKSVFKVLLLPICYLFFMVPLPEIIYNFIAFPLKLFVAKYSVLFLEMMGIIVLREGNIIMFPNIVLEVADACSGLRSLMSLLAVSVAFSFLIRTSNLRKIIIIFSALPIAIFTNAIRVIITGILAQYWGAEVAQGFFHEFAGLLVFGFAIVLLLITGIILKKR
jgi:exosortase